MGRIYNFSAGPSMLPLEILEEAKKDLTDYKGCGMSVMEMSHRSKYFQDIIDEAEADLRDLMNIPQNYKVLFLQGGGTLQFSMIPMNLLRKSGKADYILTGTWAKKAAEEAKKFGDIKVVASSADDNFTYIPRVSKDEFRSDADYIYITSNNTVYGTRFTEIPDTGDTPLVCDWSSGFISEVYDVTKFGLIYAGAQKNVGPAGVTIVIIREDLIGYAPEKTPLYLDYKIHSENGSMYNTPPCFAIYMAGLNFKWIKDQGGVAGIQKMNEEKAGLLYDAIDQSSMFICPVAIADRSLMNVVFVTGDPELDKEFIAEAEKRGMLNLAGHRSVGGMRASIYNAMPLKGVQVLTSFMKEFEEAHK